VALVLVVLVGAVAVGYLTGGSVGRLAELPMRSRWLVAAAAVAQVGGGLISLFGTAAAGATYPAAAMTAALLVAAFLARNRRLPGIALVAMGLASNAVVVAWNGVMPVSAAAARRAGVALGPLAAGIDPRHALAGAHTVLAALGDVIAVPLPLHPEVVSIGDTLIAAGLGLLVFTGMRSRRHQPGTAVRQTAATSQR
jgi:hypothetical protein